MSNIFNSLGSFVWGVIIVFITLLAGIVWYAFEYWYILIAIPVLLYIVFFITNFKKMNNEVNQLIKEVEERNKQKELNKN